MSHTTTPVLGVPVDAISFEQAQSRVLGWGRARESRYVVLANVHVVVTASTEPDFGAVVAAAAPSKSIGCRRTGAASTR